MALRFLLLLLVLLAGARKTKEEPISWETKQPGAAGIQPASCNVKCGNLTVPYPFGIGDDCYAAEYGNFGISCNYQTEGPPKAFLGESNIELEVVAMTGQLRVNSWAGHDCYDPLGNNISTFYPEIRLGDGSYPYTFSHTRNKFFVVGCDSMVLIDGGRDGRSYTGGCISYCSNVADLDGLNGSCSGVGCCETAIPKGLRTFSTEISSFYNHTRCWDFNPCTYAFVAEETNYTFHLSDLKDTKVQKQVPIVLDWSIGNKQTCEEVEKLRLASACLSSHSECANSNNGVGYFCNCTRVTTAILISETHMDAKAWIISFECDRNPTICPSNGTCVNTEGSYECRCPPGTTADDPKVGPCEKTPQGMPLALKLVLGVGVGLLLLMAVGSCVGWGLQRNKVVEQTRKIMELKQRTFEQNGGPFLQEMISSKQGNTFKIFTEEELAMATNNFDDARIIGRGGHGIVYKGTLEETDEVVAIKRSRVVEERQSKEFAREIGILSQINHVSVVKLLGCCLEVEIPMLSKHRRLSFSLDLRLRIATEAAEALAYLHSYASRPIIHGDVKTANILLDEQYRAKVSDFGASTLAPVDEMQLATVVQGTCGYLDPEYMQTYQLTVKSDVYSFGVVLSELLTGKKPLQLLGPEDERGLAVMFVSSLRENKLMQILDVQVAKDGEPERLREIADLTSRCLIVEHEGRRPSRHERSCHGTARTRQLSPAGTRGSLITLRRRPRVCWTLENRHLLTSAARERRDISVWEVM
ncbi:hypothetical protein Taro_008060 [Colocasia esculenta]|uniref:Uncharacterized protein n=1 Tax=Colocasia esculenta TaxID=4460 RepID=A0A843U006_COLES|nr:hypothetical protein [Colocasia esculenta]